MDRPRTATPLPMSLHEDVLPCAADLKQRTLRSGWKLLFSGVCLAMHFSTWVWGLKHTSLIHAV